MSTRTVYSDVKKLNELLETGGYPIIQADKGKLHYAEPLTIEFESLLASTSDFVLTNQRIRRLRIVETILLAGDQFTVEDLLKVLDISRNTLIADLKEIKEMLAIHSIAMESTPFKGYRVIGKELNIRNLLILSVSEDPLFFENRPFNDLEIIKKCEAFLDDVSGRLSVELSDVSFHRMLAAFWVTYARISMGKVFPEGPKDPLTREEITFYRKEKSLYPFLEQRCP